MSKRLDIYRAIVALVTSALPGAQVVCGEDEDSLPARTGVTGRAVVRTGDPGEPEVDLGILTYWYDHAFPVELTVPALGNRSAEEQADVMSMAIGAAIAADRTLGGRCAWLDVTAVETADVFMLDHDVAAARPPRSADLAIVATYGVAGTPLA